jgi:hypothetical protein
MVLMVTDTQVCFSKSKVRKVHEPLIISEMGVCNEVTFSKSKVQTMETCTFKNPHDRNFSRIFAHR